MDTVFLPGNVRQRLSDLMKRYNVSQTELARKIGCNDSLLSRFLSEKTDKLSDENIIRIIRALTYLPTFFRAQPLSRIERIMKLTNWDCRRKWRETSIPEKQMRRSLIICWKARAFLN